MEQEQATETRPTDAAGNPLYHVPEENLPKLRERITKLNRRACEARDGAVGAHGDRRGVRDAQEIRSATTRRAGMNTNSASFWSP